MKRKQFHLGFRRAVSLAVAMFFINIFEIKSQHCWNMVSTRYGHAAAIDTANKLWSWGRETYGVLGIPPGDVSVNTHLPHQIGTGTTWQMVSSGANHALALKTDGTMWGWGLYDGFSQQSYFPVQITSFSNWRLVSAGWDFSAAIKTDGTLWTWGYNNHGQLGDGTTSNRTEPAQVGSDSHWEYVVATYFCILAIKTDGTLWAWGNNQFGELGDGTNIDKHVPIQIGTGTDWKFVSSEEDHCLALKTDGSLWGWGLNYFGQIGDGSIINRNIPVQITTATDWKDVSAGASHSLGIRTDGSLWAWGENLNGELGNGSNGYEHYYLPAKSRNETNWKRVFSSYMYSFGEKNDGSFWAWGWNNDGQLGDGTTDQQNLPERLICGSQVVLPVTLLSFTALKQTMAVTLNWQTTTELNFAYFEVERSKNASDFEKVGTVVPPTNSSMVKSYQYTDMVPYNGTNYYRLKQFNSGGSFTYSKTISVHFIKKGSLLFPNPASSVITINAAPGLTGIEVINATGNCVWQMKPLQGNQYNISTLPKGMYIIKLLYADNYEVLKFNKQ